MNTSGFLFLATVLIVFLILLIGCGVVAPASSEELPTGADPEWNIMVIGDNSMWGHGEAIISQIEKALA